MAPVDRALRDVLKQHALPTGTSLENTVTWRLHRLGALDKTQYRVGPYRLDYAWPAKLIALEADGPFHRQPDGAAKDVIRDAYLRARGWLVFRVDDTSDTLENQVCRVVAVINTDRGHDWTTGYARREAEAQEAAKSAQWAAKSAQWAAREEAIAARIAELDELAGLQIGGHHATT